jgi:hypothetical protein
MAILDRVKERIETDLSDSELDAMITAVQAEIDRRFGAVGAITVHLDGDRDLYGDHRFLTLWRALDGSQTVTVVEIDGTDETTLAADDYRVLHGGRTLERLVDGTNGRKRWQRLVRVAYTPVSDQPQRDEVTIKLVQLDVEYRGLSGERAGDWQASYPDAAAEREKLLASLAPRPRLAMA